jgi:hypothetical protein
MNILPFEWSESTLLATELARPLKQVSLESEPHGWPMFVTLWRPDGTGLRVRSEMHDVAERREVGVLCFSHVLAPASNATLISVAPTFDRELAILRNTSTRDTYSPKFALILPRSPSGPEGEQSATGSVLKYT